MAILKLIISGGQNGADISGIKAAKKCGIPTGGWMPKGFRTLDGPKPEYAELYGMKEHLSNAYPPRTFANVKDSEGTIRFAQDMDSSGEKCTLRGIVQYGKPHFDVHIKNVAKFALPEDIHPATAAKWIKENKITVLNVAGNSEQTAPGIGAFVERYMEALIKCLAE